MTCDRSNTHEVSIRNPRSHIERNHLSRNILKPLPSSNGGLLVFSHRNSLSSLLARRVVVNRQTYPPAQQHYVRVFLSPCAIPHAMKWRPYGSPNDRSLQSLEYSVPDLPLIFNLSFSCPISRPWILHLCLSVAKST